MPRDERTYIAVHDGLTDHPKVEGLSDKAFRALVELWCWSSRNLTDGQVPEGTWRKRVPAKARSELLAAGLFETTHNGVVAHDYLEHQRSRETVETIRRARRDAGAMANHQRWHVGKSIVKPDCLICCPGGDPTDRDPETVGIPDGSQDGSATAPSAVRPASAAGPTSAPPTLRDGSQVGSVLGSGWDPSGSPESDTPSSLRSEGGAADPATEPPPTRCPAHVGWLTPPSCGRCRDLRLAAERAEKAAAAAANTAPTYSAPRCPEHPQHSSVRCPSCAADAAKARQHAVPWRERVKLVSADPDDGQPSHAAMPDDDDQAAEADQAAWEAHLADIADAHAEAYLAEQALMGVS